MIRSSYRGADGRFASVEDAIKKLKNPRPFLSKVGDVMIADTKNRIRSTKVDPNGRPWARWAESTEKAREREGSARGGILFRTGSLYNSIFKTFQQNRVVVSSASPYAGFHQFGTRRMPARPFIGVSAQANTQINKLVDSYLGLKT